MRRHDYLGSLPSGRFKVPKHRADGPGVESVLDLLYAQQGRRRFAHQEGQDSRDTPSALREHPRWDWELASPPSPLIWHLLKKAVIDARIASNRGLGDSDIADPGQHFLHGLNEPFTLVSRKLVDQRRQVLAFFVEKRLKRSPRCQ